MIHDITYVDVTCACVMSCARYVVCVRYVKKHRPLYTDRHTHSQIMIDTYTPIGGPLELGIKTRGYYLRIMPTNRSDATMISAPISTADSAHSSCKLSHLFQNSTQSLPSASSPISVRAMFQALSHQACNCTAFSATTFARWVLVRIRTVVLSRSSITLSSITSTRIIP